MQPWGVSNGRKGLGVWRIRIGAVGGSGKVLIASPGESMAGKSGVPSLRALRMNWDAGTWTS